MSTTLFPSPEVLDALNDAFTTPARNLTKSRGKNIHRFASAKMGRRVSVESSLECDACYHFDFAKSIRRFCSQPIRYSYVLDGTRHKYVPDFLVEFENGEFVLYEVKNDIEVSSFQFKKEFKAKVAAAEEFGIALELIEEHQIRTGTLFKNLKLIHRYASRNDLSQIQRAVLSILSSDGAQRIESLMSRTGLSRQRIMPIICDLLSKCLLEADLDIPLTQETEIGLAYA
ncbi:TnsA endonuclease N-terminal domain-containing protein [Photobacterium sagamiensis]|uniref:TnsA endonuclease N-terminal domain-containing protein n=1 Tax=Photobacterium sagamiensis TaxID=2910241 RepID=UPI003D0FE839